MGLVDKIINEIRKFAEEFPLELADFDPFREAFYEVRVQDAQWDANFHLSQINHYLNLVMKYPLGNLTGELKEAFEFNMRTYSDQPFRGRWSTARSYLDLRTLNILEQQRIRLKYYVDLYFD